MTKALRSILNMIATPTQRAGSYRCHEPYCRRYRVSARLGRETSILDRKPRLSRRCGCRRDAFVKFSRLPHLRLEES